MLRGILQAALLGASLAFTCPSAWATSTATAVGVQAEVVLSSVLFSALPKGALPTTANQDIPRNDGWITDQADLLSPSKELQLAALMASYESGSGNQMALLTIPSLDGRSLEKLSLDVARDWGIGQAGKDNGALLLIAKADRKMRIEVGRKLEGELTDLICGRIIRDIIRPRFRANDYPGGIEAGIRAMHAAAGGDYGPIKAASKRQQSTMESVMGLAFILLFLFLMRRGGGGGRGMSPWIIAGSLLGGGHSGNRGGGFGGGLGGGGGGGFGGFGGGGFGGGGASGGWCLGAILSWMTVQGWSDWEAVGHGFEDAWIHWAARFGWWLLLAVFLFVLVKALLRNRRYLAVNRLSEADSKTLEAKIQTAEEQTDGELVFVLLERSDAHPQGLWAAAFTTMATASILLAGWLPWEHPMYVLLCQLVFAAVGALAARWLPDFQRTFVREVRATEMAEEQAAQEFQRHELLDTTHRSAVLIFISLFERRVIVLADEGVHASVKPEAWLEVDEAILKGIRKNSLLSGLNDGIDRATEILSNYHPKQVKGDDDNELPNEVVIRKE